MKKHYLSLFIIIFLFFSAKAQLLEKSERNSLKKQYTELLELAKNSNQVDSVQIILFTQLIEPFIYFEYFPEHFKKYDGDYFKDENIKAKIEWISYNIKKLTPLLDPPPFSTTIYVDKNDTLLLLNHEHFINFQYLRTPVSLNFRNEFKPALNIIDSAKTYILNKSSIAYSKKLEETHEKYQNKYFLGYRDRNLLGFFIDGYLVGKKQNKMLKRYDEEKGLLEDPSRGAVIILAPPIIALSSNSISEIKVNSNLYGLVQVLGYDVYVGQSFKNYIGLSVFHASPLNATNGLWENSLVGVEAHFSNKLNIGYAISYQEIDTGSEKGRISKVFVSVSLFNKFFKK